MTVQEDLVRHTRAYDLLFAVPVAIFYGFAAAGIGILIARRWERLSGWPEGFQIAQDGATLIFFGMQAGLILVRHLPIAKAQGLAPRAFAMLGANLNFALLLLPRAALSGFWTALSYTLTFVGVSASAAVLAYLGRSFSILPDARSPVMEGPYRFVRHPLYLAELVAMLGIMLGFAQPWALLIVLAAFAFQLKRMDYEETVLQQAFPQYAAYVRKTARLVPGIY